MENQISVGSPSNYASFSAKFGRANLGLFLSYTSLLEKLNNLSINETGELLMNILTAVKIIKGITAFLPKRKKRNKTVVIKKIYNKGETVMKTLKAFIKTFIIVGALVVLFVPYVRDENGAYWLFKVPGGGQAYHRTTLGLVILEKLKAFVESKKAKA